MSIIEPRTSVVTIYTGDYLDRIRHLEQRAGAAKEAEGGEPRVLSEVPEYVRLAEEHDALVAEAESKAIHVKLRALRRRTEWRPLVDAHPPREGDATDKFVGFNYDEMREVAVAKCIVEPELSEDDLDDFSEGDYERLWQATYELNCVSGGDPKGNLVSRLSQTSDETSN